MIVLEVVALLCKFRYIFMHNNPSINLVTYVKNERKDIGFQVVLMFLNEVAYCEDRLSRAGEDALTL